MPGLLIEMGQGESHSLPGLACSLNPPHFQLQRSLDYRCEPPHTKPNVFIYLFYKQNMLD
jgi:hypothetical protein